MMKVLESEILPGEMIPNVATLLQQNAARFSNNFVFFEKDAKQTYQGIKWKEFYDLILNVAFGLKQSGLQNGDKVILFARNSLKMLIAELAVISSGGIAVPIFSNFKKETAELLVRHSDARYLIAGGATQLDQLGDDLNLEKIWSIDEAATGGRLNASSFQSLLEVKRDKLFQLDTLAASNEICLNMYTSGTMGIPKCVQLSHKNILSQQAALNKVWSIGVEDRFLGYLPWHHSFGGIFELFSALYNGAPYYLESSYGKEVTMIFENWKQVKPTVFFSVPKVYQSLFELTIADKNSEDLFFNSGLKFVFTAAAALPEKLSNEFEKRNIPVMEGWGLTETSPCCTLTNPKFKREVGVVGKPIPGVSIRIGDEDEIQVKGPNVMCGYYKNDEANKDIFTSDGWYRTGDVGTITENGLKLISRKDRIFKLSNGEKVIPSDLERAIELQCHYVQYAIVTGSGEEHPVALIFPNKKLLSNPDYQISPDEGCFCPRSLNELGRCLTGCLAKANESIGQKFSKVRSAAIIFDELNLDNKTLTPSLKVAPKNVVEKYKSHLLNLYGKNVPVDEEVYVIELDPQKRRGKCTS